MGRLLVAYFQPANLQAHVGPPRPEVSIRGLAAKPSRMRPSWPTSETLQQVKLLVIYIYIYIYIIYIYIYIYHIYIYTYHIETPKKLKVLRAKQKKSKYF